MTEQEQKQIIKWMGSSDREQHEAGAGEEHWDTEQSNAVAAQALIPQ